MLSASLRRKIRLQESLGRLAFPLVGPVIKFLLVFVGRYRIDNLKEIRTRVEAVLIESRKNQAPLLLCSNHLTFIDSILLLWAFAPVWRYLVDYERFFWNVPAADIFAKAPLFKWIGILGKCIFVHRTGSVKHKVEVFETLRYLLSSGRTVFLFPEGRRSRSGLVEADRLTAGTARLALQVPKCRLFCFYVRSDLQSAYSEYPPRSSHIHIQMNEIDLAPFRTIPKPKRYLAATASIGATLQVLESRYFHSHPLAARPVALESRKTTSRDVRLAYLSVSR